MNTLDKYFKDIRKIQVLTLEQEKELATRIRKGDIKARNELIMANTRFVVTIARGYLGRGLELEDLISSGNVGLIKAAERFDPEAGFRFITYAVWWIRQFIIQAFTSEARMIRLPMNVVGIVSQINKASELFEKLEGRLPSEMELHKLTKIPLEEILSVTSVSGRVSSLNKPVKNEEDGEVGDLIEDISAKPTDGGLRQDDLEIDVQISLKNVLSPKEIKIVSGSFGIGEPVKTDEEIGKEIGTGPERVRQLRERCIRKLRKNPATTRRLAAYLG